MNAKDYAKVAFSEDQPLDLRWNAICKVREEVLFKLKKLEELSWRYEEISKSIQKKSLKKFKEMLQIRFMTKYAEDIKAKRYIPAMIRDFEKLEKMEVMGCYTFKGIKVIKEDCDLCHRRCTVKGNALEEE